ncbi:MAG TPA: site-specific DNA-methyltransferase [Acetobacteraceae bacterium]|jgi:site-specific DNA-methyltransferase (adenine-specific)|nr:site-specific DNA-methyltransferase [Acetobacteraceae bacterium]
MEQIAAAELSRLSGAHRLICGDCLTVLPTLAAGTVDVVVTSPPYNLGIAYRGYDDRRAEEDYLDWLIRVATEIRRVMKEDASFFLNISGSSSAPWLPFELIVRLRPLFVLQNHITWIKSIATKRDSVGHFKPVGGQRFLHHNHEHIFHLTLSGDVKLDRLAIGVPFKDKSNIARRGHARDLRCRGNTWFIPYDTVQSKAAKFHHPSTFPVALPRWCIRLHGRKKTVALDPFMGTGTTMVAAQLEGASGIGIDMDPAYVAIAQARLVEAGHVQDALTGL